MQKKVLAFVVNNEKILALYSEPHPEHGKGGWFTVTGGVEENESYEQAVRREILEETNLLTKKIIPLNWGSIYNWRPNICEELNYLAFVESGEIKLNEEHIKYEWLTISDFIDKIKWSDDKNILKKVLEKALKGDLFFKNIKMVDYRKNRN